MKIKITYYTDCEDVKYETSNGIWLEDAAYMFNEPDKIEMIVGDGHHNIKYEDEIEMKNFGDVINFVTSDSVRHDLYGTMTEKDLARMARHSLDMELYKVLNDCWTWDCPEVEPVARELCSRLDINFESYENYDDLFSGIEEKL